MYKSNVIFIILLFFGFDKVFALVESEVFPGLVYQSALEEGNIEVIEKYLELGQSSNKKNKYNLIPLAYAVKNNSKKMIDLLIKNGANINNVFLDKTSILMYCVMLDKNNLIDYVIEKGVDINLQDGLGRTALMIAIEKENRTAVEKIIKKNPNMEITDFSGNSIFEYINFIRDRKIKNLVEKFKF